MTDTDEINTSETTVGGMRAVVEIRWEDTQDNDVVELVYLVLFNERTKPLKVVAGNTKGTVVPEGFTEILVGYRTSKQSWKIQHVDTDVGQVIWDSDIIPPTVQIDPNTILT